MKEKALAALLSLALLLVLPLPASAAEASTQIYCTFSGLRPEAPPVTSAPAQPSYAVNIPATYNTNTTPCLAITASKMDIGAGKLLTVSLMMFTISGSSSAQLIRELLRKPLPVHVNRKIS